MDDLVALAYASRAWGEQRVLYAAHLTFDEGSTPEVAEANARASRKAVEQMRDRLRETGETVAELFYEFDRTLQLAQLAPGGRKIVDSVLGQISHHRSIGEDTATIATQLRTILGSLQIEVPPVPAFVVAEEIGSLKDRSSSTQFNWSRLVPLILRRDEALQFVIHGRGVGGHHNLSSTPSVIVVTDKRLIGLKLKRFSERGEHEFNLPLDIVKKAEQTTAWNEPVLRITLNRGSTLLVEGEAVELEMERAAAVAAIRITSIRDGRQRNTSVVGPIWPLQTSVTTD